MIADRNKVLEVPCLACGEKHSFTIGQLMDNKALTAPCGATIDTEELQNAIKETEAMMSAIRGHVK